MTLPKPAPRGPRPKKRIARGRRRKKRGPTKAQALKKLKKDCHDTWSRLVRRSGECRFAHGVYHDGVTPHECKGPHQACHGFGKKAHPSVRYLLINGVEMCAAAHAYYTHQPHRWENFLRDEWGPDVYDELYRIACGTAKHDYEAIIAAFRAELGTVEG